MKFGDTPTKSIVIATCACLRGFIHHLFIETWKSAALVGNPFLENVFRNIDHLLQLAR